MHTEADNCRDRAVQHIKDAVKELSKIVIDETYGHNEYNTDYRELLFSSMLELQQMRLKLEP